MTVYWLLLGFVPVAAVWYIIRLHRKKSSQQAAEREARVAQLFNESKAQPGAAAAPAAAAIPAAARAAPVGEPPVPYCAKPRMLTQPHAVLYYLLKSALPDHEIFVHLNLAGVIEVDPQVKGAERDERRRAISQLTVDCAVCSKTLGMVVAIDLVPAGTATATFKARCLEAASVRYLQIDPVKLPKRGAVRELVLGRPG